MSYRCECCDVLPGLCRTEQVWLTRALAVLVVVLAIGVFAVFLCGLT